MGHMYRRSAALAFLIAAAVVLSAPSAFAQAPTDHFKCYNATEGTLEPPIVATLDDQFVTGDEVQVLNAVWFCNPVQKTVGTGVTPITEPLNHLTLYPISVKETAPARRVLISNQFGDQTITVTAPRLLAVPTEKNDEGEPDNISHFKCYEAEGPALNAPVVLQDQFDMERVRLLAPRFLCNPATKTVGGVTTAPELDEQHLACYTLNPSARPPRDFVDIENQFETDVLQIEASNFVCVPSGKTEL
jgi:hypothetical protein